ncbi:MAG: hypothetical protein ACRDMZ_06115, partial [Solirubrobacteraceae bacterium]
KGGGGGAVSTAVVELAPATHESQPVYLGSFDIKNTSSVEADTRFELEALFDASGGGGGVMPEVRCGNGRVPPYQTARVEVWIPRIKDIGKTLFGSVTVYLSTDVERQVARRAIKVRPEERAAAVVAVGAEHK